MILFVFLNQNGYSSPSTFMFLTKCITFQGHILQIIKEIGVS
jgi:hypothetical protein